MQMVNLIPITNLRRGETETEIFRQLVESNALPLVSQNSDIKSPSGTDNNMASVGYTTSTIDDSYYGYGE